ncbi:hypothetical protein ScPMuIL_004199 [Solemya velum]
MSSSTDASLQEQRRENILLAPFEYICQIRGKEIRSKLAVAFNYWMKIPTEKLQIIGEATQMLHNSSLLIDDIEDNSKLRRGIPVAHNIYGVAHTINTANYVYFLGLDKVLKLDHPEAPKFFTAQMLELHRGQGMDIYWRDAIQCPEEEEYKEMVIRKTGGLFGLAVGLMQLFSDNKSDFKPLLDNLGLFFQIRDDYANLISKEYEANKSYCEDLTEGKFSFPIVHAIKSKKDKDEVLCILRQRTTDIDVKKYCVSILEKAGSFEYTKQFLITLEERLLELIQRHGGNPHLMQLIIELSKIYRNGH